MLIGNLLRETSTSKPYPKKTEKKEIAEELVTMGLSYITCLQDKQSKEGIALGMSLLKEAADRGCKEAQYYFAYYSAQGLSVPHNAYPARKYYYKAANQGHMEAQYQFALCCENSIGGRRKLLKAKRYYEFAALQGHVDAQFRVALFYHFGLENRIAIDISQAIYFYELAANQRHLDAVNNLGSIYEEGKIVKQDLKMAFEYYRSAQMQKHPLAQYNLGRFYEYGLCVTQSLQVARRLYWEAAVQGNVEAEFRYAYFCENGFGGEINALNAATFYNRAAKNGHGDAQVRLQRLIGITAVQSHYLTKEELTAYRLRDMQEQLTNNKWYTALKSISPSEEFDPISPFTSSTAFCLDFERCRINELTPSKVKEERYEKYERNERKENKNRLKS